MGLPIIVIGPNSELIAFLFVVVSFFLSLWFLLTFLFPTSFYGSVIAMEMRGNVFVHLMEWGS